ncbi:RNA methyltransferase [Tistrella mobilis]|uniref:TrmH family RNA methyltransferase n=1 Tax=Tistrella mobilis TaxID=171437 RepID=UPI0035579CA8
MTFEIDARPVSSLSNPAVKRLAGLHLKKNREATGLFLVEGLRAVIEGVELGFTLEEVVFVDRLRDLPPGRRLAKLIAGTGARALEVTPEVLVKIARRDNPQTVIGAFRRREFTLADVRPEPGALWVVLEGIKDPGNLGTVLRTLDAVKGAGAILVGDTCDPWSVEAVRATMGSLFVNRIVRAPMAAFLDWRRGWTGTVVGTALTAAVDYRLVDYRPPLLLMMGNEQSGLPPQMVEACDRTVKIPMLGRADSLNLAVSTGIMLYEVVRCRQPLAES